MAPSELAHQRAIFEKAGVGVVETRLNGDVSYANPQGLALLGITSYEGANLGRFYVDPNLLAEQLSERKAGLIGNYRTQVRRSSDQQVLPVQVTAIPITDETGQVTGSFALFRHPLEEEINRIHQESGEADSVLFRVMQVLHMVIPFDVVIATHYSDDFRHAHPFFVYRPNSARGRVEWTKVWQSVPAELRPQVESEGTTLVTDLLHRLQDPSLGHLKGTALVQGLLADGLRSCIRRTIRRKGRPGASVTFYARDPAALTEEHRSRIAELPIAAGVIQAIDHFDRRREAERHKLLREVAYCPTIEAVYEALLRRLCEIFGWEHASLYRVDHARGKVRLVGRCQPPALPVVAGLDDDRDIDEGLLGRVVRTGKAQVVADIEADPGCKRPEDRPGMRSALCWPISLENDARVRWIIDIEDRRPDAFSEDEKRWLGETAHEVGGFMQRLSNLNFLDKCLECTSEPMVVVDAHDRIKRANAAAGRLFDTPDGDPKALQGSIGQLFESALEAQRAFDAPDGRLGEFAALRFVSGGYTPAEVSRHSLPPDIGGAIYAFKDVRPMRRALELELLEQTAYQIALETRTPLTYVISTMERSARHGAPLSVDSTERLLKYLYRAQHAYTKLAMYNTSVRSAAGLPRPIDLATEIRLIHGSLPEEMASLVALDLPEQPSHVICDCFQIGFVLETLLLTFIRCAPEDIPVVVSLRADDGRVTVRIEGHVGAGMSMPGRSEGGGSLPSEERLAFPLIRDYLQANAGTVEEQRLSADRVRYAVSFDGAP